ncbi:hypothetical protein P691DRAFT_229338 [Macrolepiota fuliginosa MF-IS2]|uniref:Uncharacterized protein n=1 Tax=Macrolepiota fuliginosa MF-IS2 TaxID=1400762 RepID=A0A9P6BVL3_9AGAR|nr:hypothetical protein P691DRAFT_229338 [Macrolepiota fuliginosa MF-IS2]
MGILASSALDPTCPFEGKTFHRRHPSLCIASSSLVGKSLLSQLLALSAVIPETNSLQHPSNPSAAFFFAAGLPTIFLRHCLFRYNGDDKSVLWEVFEVVINPCCDSQISTGVRLDVPGGLHKSTRGCKRNHH